MTTMYMRDDLFDSDGAKAWMDAHPNRSYNLSLRQLKRLPVNVKKYLIATESNTAISQALIQDRNPELRQLIASRTFLSDYKQLIPRLMRDRSPLVRTELVRSIHDRDTSTNAVLDALRTDKDDAVRLAVAQHGREQDLDLFVTDKNASVRAVVALGRNDEHLDMLVNDPDPRVRVAVARIGRDTDLDVLYEDYDAEVRAMVISHARPQDVERMLSDDSWLVRQTVAENVDKIDEMLRVWSITDENPVVRRTAMLHATGLELTHLVDDVDREVSVYAGQKLLELQNK